MKALVPVLFVFLMACKTETPKVDTSNAWENFKNCSTENCIQQATLVKDELLKNPKKVLSDFQATYENGDDHVIGWLYLLRDSFLLNPKLCSSENQLTIQKSIINTITPFLKDPKLGEMAQTVINEIKDLKEAQKLENATGDNSQISESNIVGEWQSTDDPKFSISFKNGQYQENYEGQKQDPPLKYSFNSICPKDCNPVAEMPCLKITGQDDICYAIIKADGKSLELSQIGGTGNTNHYKRK